MNFPENPGLHALALAVLATERHTAQRKDGRELDAFCHGNAAESPVPSTHILERIGLRLEKFLEVLRVRPDFPAESSLLEQFLRILETT